MASVRQDILVVCLVESSVTVLHEWSDILVKYVSPLLQRIASTVGGKDIRNDLKIGFVSYSDSYVHPSPILARRFFSPVIQFTNQLREDLPGFGLGRTASNGQKGMAVLEGYVAVLEMFDAVSETRPLPLQPQSQNEAQPEISPNEPNCYLVHIASFPPNNATKPSSNNNRALDNTTWGSLPSEILKRKIRTNMILTRPIPELLDLFKHTSRGPPDIPWFNPIKTSHKLLFSGLPVKDLKTIPQKRPATEALEGPKPSAPRPQAQAPPVNQPPTTNTPPIATNPIPSPSRPAPNTTTVPPAEHSQSQVRPPTQPQQPATHPTRVFNAREQQAARLAEFGQTIDPAKIIAAFKAVEDDLKTKSDSLRLAMAAGKPQTEIDQLKKAITAAHQHRVQIQTVYNHARRHQALAKGTALAPNPVTNVPNLQPPNLGPNPPVSQAQPPPDVHVSPPHAGPSGQDTQTLSQGNVSIPNFATGNLVNKNSFQNILPAAARSGMEAQMEKMLAERTRPPVLAAAPQTQPQPHVAPQTNTQTNVSANTTQGQSSNASNPGVDVMIPRATLGPHPRRWQGMLAWPTGNVVDGVRREHQLNIAVFAQDPNLSPEMWPQKLILSPSRCLMNMQQIQGWVKEFGPSMGLLSTTPILGNLQASVDNVKLFRQLKEILHQKGLLAFCKFDLPGGPMGTGFITFPFTDNIQGDVLVTMIFYKSPLPPILTGSISSNQMPPDAGNSSKMPSIPQSMSTGQNPMSLQDMSPEAKALFLQKRKALIAAYNQQLIQAQQKGLVPNAGSSSANPAPAPPFNIAQLVQGMQLPQQQPQQGDNQMGLGGLNIPQASALQQVQHRQPLGLNAAQMANLHMIQQQYGLNRRPSEGSGQ